MPMPNLVAIGENETYAISTGPLHVDQRDLESVSRAGYSSEEINLALEENQRQEPLIEHLQADFLSGNSDRKVLNADPVKVDSFHNLAFAIAEEYTFANLNGKLKVWDMQSANTPAARVTKDSSGSCGNTYVWYEIRICELKAADPW